MSQRRVMVGLGNPGPQYRATRHNVGFHVVDRLLAKYPPERSYTKFEADIFQVRGPGGRVWLLARPRTYMNLSGKTVAGLAHYYDLPLDDLIVVCDDFHLPLGRLRFRRGGSHGGQKGLADIIERLGTDAFARVRIGIAAPDGDPIEHVLGTFAPDERPVIDDAVERAADGLEVWADAGLEAAMNRFNAVL